MPQIPAGADQKKPIATKHRPLLVPPEEQFWKKYSAHNEFPLSNATSIALHIIGIGLILLMAWIIDKNRTPPPASDVAIMDPVSLDSGDGTAEKNGGGGGGNDGGKRNLPKENVDGGTRTDDTPPIDYEGPPLEDVREAEPVEVSPEKDGKEPPPVTSVQKELTDIGRQAQSTLRKATAGKGKDRPGSDGGRGGGKDKGVGRGKDRGRGEGPPGEAARKRAARQIRWKLIFNRNSDGPDYRDKLKALGAILVVAEFKLGANGRPILDARGRGILQYRLVIRDISPSARPRVEDVRQIRGIFWIDDKRESVRALAEALGIKEPPLFACFFPIEVERELRSLEHQKYKGPEEDIFETHFHVDLTGGGPGYRLICDDVILKR
jgi:hypothetical protein